MIRRHERRFDEIARIEIRTAWKTVNIERQFHGELLTFAVNVGTDAAKAILAGSRRSHSA
jgi:hypothetical protein